MTSILVRMADPAAASTPPDVGTAAPPAAAPIAAVAPNPAVVVPDEQEPVVSTDSLRSGLRQAGPLAVAGVLANAANVIVTVLMARLLSTRGYGALAQLIGVFLIVSMPGSAVVVGVVRHVTEWKGRGSAVRVWQWARRLHLQSTVFLAVFVLAIVLARGDIATALSLPDALGIVGVIAAGALWILLSLDRGLLQAHRDYRALSWNLLVEGGTRTIATLGLVGAGFGVAGAAWGIFLAELVTMIHARLVADRAWSREAKRELERTGAADVVSNAIEPIGVTGRIWSAVVGWLRLLQPDRSLRSPVSDRRRVMLDIGVALLAMSLLAVLQNIDVIVLGREAPSASGGYAAISVASKALVFAAIVLGGYLVPEAAIRWWHGEHALRQLAVTLLLLAVPAFGLFGVAVFFPRLLLSVVFSNRYLGATHAFLWLVLAMMFLSMTVVLTMYLLAIGQRIIGAILFAGAAATTGAVALAHGSATRTAVADLTVQAVLAGVTLIVFIRVHRQRFSLNS